MKIEEKSKQKKNVISLVWILTFTLGLQYLDRQIIAGAVNCHIYHLFYRPLQ